MRKDEIMNSYPCIDKVKNKFTWAPKTSFAKGIKKTIKFYEVKKN